MRETGVLCHISSLPGKYGIGSLGKQAYRFARRLRACGVKYWQVLPLVQTGYGDSPYSSVACTSGNPYFIDLDLLAGEGLLTAEECREARHLAGPVAYGSLYNERYVTLRKAFSRFNFDGEDFRAFVRGGSAEDYALFMTAKRVYGENFLDWEDALKFHAPDAVEKLRTDFHEEYLFWNFLQYEFTRQWQALKGYCNSIGLGALQVLLLSVLFYSGAGQFMIPNMYLAASPLASIIASVSLVNTRQMLYAASFAPECKGVSKRLAFFFAATVTDESYGVSTAKFREGSWSVDRALMVNLFSQTSWTVSNVIGVLIGAAVSIPLNIASFAMTSIFICLLVTQKVTSANIVAVVCAMVGVYVCKAVGLSGPAILVGALVGVAAAMVYASVRDKRLAKEAADR